jgi:hypothetical protein
MNEDLQAQINTLKRDLQDLTDEVYRTNFTAQQDFPKYSNFTTRIKIPVFATKPSTCEIGEVCSNGGKLWHCSAINTWSSQT